MNRTNRMAAQDKLLYFPFRARAEPIRMIYALAGKSLTDERVAMEEWPKFKADQPLGQLPVLTCPEGTLVMSNTIARYAAKKFGMAGSNLWEETLNDLVVEAVSDSFQNVATKITAWKFLKIAPEPDNPEKVIEEVYALLVKNLSYIQKVAEKRGAKFLTCDTISVGDIWLYSSLEFAKSVYPDIMEVNDWVKEFVSKVTSDDRMKTYLADRPDAPL